MLAMWVPELPFQLAVQRDGALKDRPLAFLSPRRGSMAVLWLVNARARQEGLRPGDPMDWALQEARGLRVLDPTPQTWWEAQGSFRDFLEQWTPQGQMARMGEALIELRGTEALHGAPQDAARKLQRDLKASRGWVSRGGMSASATAAGFASRAGEPFVEVPEGLESKFLAPLPLRRMAELQPRLLWRFRRLGLHALGDVQPVPLPILAQLMPSDEAPRLLAKVRGEDRPRLPLLTEPQGRSVHRLRLEPPCLPEAAPVARWILERLWSEPRSPRSLRLAWWDMDGLPHRWAASELDLLEPTLALSRRAEQAFHALSTRRALVHRLELRVSWGLGQAVGLFQGERTEKLGRLERAMARLRCRFPERPVLPLWAADQAPPYRAEPP